MTNLKSPQAGDQYPINLELEQPLLEMANDRSRNWLMTLSTPISVAGEDLRRRINYDRNRTVELARLIRQLIVQARQLQLAKDYVWALIPLVVFGSLSINTHSQYDTFLGYDMPAHFENGYAVLRTGSMPPLPNINDPGFYISEAFQPPLYYILTSWVMRFGESISVDGYKGYIPTTLFLLSMIWFCLIVYIVQQMMGNVPRLLRALTVCVIMLLPINIMIGSMYTNDFPAGLLMSLILFVFWQMSRQKRELDRRWWLRIAVLIGITFLVKNVGALGVFVYGIWTVCITVSYSVKHQWRNVRRVSLYAFIGLPFMLIPYTITTLYSGRGTLNPINIVLPGITPVGLGQTISFMTSFDSGVLTAPLTVDSGAMSFWSRQFITIFSDPYGVWYTNTAAKYLPVAPRLANAQFLMHWAIPVALLMILGAITAFYKTVRHPGRALRNGMLVIFLGTLAMQIAFMILQGSVQNVLAVLHARYSIFLYPFLIILGILAIWRFAQNNQGIVIPIAKLLFWVSLIVFCFAAIQFLWLSPN